MSSHFRQLVSPFVRYWRIKFPGKLRWSVCVPAILGLVASILIYNVDKFNVADDRGLIHATLPLLSLLVGFYVAALGVSLTIGAGHLDMIPKDRPPVERGEPITWRDFTASLFAHLVAASLTAHILGVLVLVGAPLREDFGALLLSENPALAVRLCRTLAGGSYIFLLAHLLAATMFGLFLMADRLPKLRAEHGSRKAAEEQMDRIKKDRSKKKVQRRHAEDRTSDNDEEHNQEQT